MKFLALFLSLPAREATGRMRLWRALRTMGCGLLRDGVHLLPDLPANAEALQAIASEVVALGGNAELVRLEGRDAGQEQALRALFDRDGDYAALAGETRSLLAELPALEEATAQRRVNQLGRRLEQLIAIDFFPGESRTQCLALLDGLRRELARLTAPDEPSPDERPLPRLNPKDYRRRIWATRRRPRIDRLACAWLIRRRIDPRARIVWLESPADCHSEWLGFDFDGAAFSHVGHRVSFETLLASFGLEDDPALIRLAAIVHQLDVGGLPVAEAAGVDAVLAGIRAGRTDDDRLLAEAMKVFDWLIASFTENHDD